MSALGAHDESHEHHGKALAIRHDVLGADHHHTADSYHGLGVIKTLLGAHHEAEDLHHKALNIRIKTYGEDHRHTAHSFHELGIVKHLKGDVAHAMELLKKALHLRRQHYGDDHSHTQDSHTYHAVHFGAVPAHAGSDASLLGRLQQVSRQTVQGIKSLFH